MSEQKKETIKNHYRLFLASPGDVAKERDAVEEVVKTFNQREGKTIHIDVIRWEDHSTPNFGRPQDTIFENTKFEETDIFVCIFWSRMGTPSGKRNPKTEEEFISGTMEEFQEGLALLEAGQIELNRFMVYFCKRAVKLDSVAETEQHMQVKKFEEELINSKKVLLGHYESIDNFKYNFKTDLDKAASKLIEPLKAEPEAENFGESVTRTCNRKFHFSQFYTFFNNNVNTLLGCPQFILIHGEEEQGHNSFIERLKSTHIKEFIDRKFPLEKAIIKQEEVDWPDEGDLALRCEHLQSKLFTTFDKSYFSKDFIIDTFSKLTCFHTTALVMIQHDINLESWDETTTELLSWYMKDYWFEFKNRNNVPLFLVFFCLTYPKDIHRNLYSKLFGKRPKNTKEILNDIEGLFDEKNEGCPGKVIKELTSPKLREVKEWLKHHRLCMNEISQEKLIERFFRIPYQGNYEVCMAEIELRLDEIFAHITDEKRNLII